MQAILLAAGKSSRLKPISDKNLLEFCGKPLIQHRVESLLKAGVEKVVIVGNRYNLDQINHLFKNQQPIELAEQNELNNSQADGVLAGAAKINSEKVLIMSTNDVFDDSLIDHVIKAAHSPVDGVIAGKKVAHYFPGGYLSVDQQNFLTDIIEKPGAGNEPSNLVNMVLHAYNNFSVFVNYLKNTEAEADGRYETALDQYIKQGEAKMLIYEYSGFWQAIKYPWHVLLVMNYFLSQMESHIDPSAQIASSAIINGPVKIEAGAKVLDHAIINGPAYIGKNSVIANHTLVRSSMIGHNSVVGFGSEIARSYFNHQVWTHANYIGDSVVDFNVSFGAGTVLGNLRFDEAEIKVKIKEERVHTGTHKFGAIIGNGVRFGTNATTSPGVKIGENTFIGANVLVERDIEKGKISLVKQELNIIDNHKQADNNKRVL